MVSVTNSKKQSVIARIPPEPAEHTFWRGRPVIRGIAADARILSVTRQHLYLVLNGKRDSKPLIKRYRALKANKGGDGK